MKYSKTVDVPVKLTPLEAQLARAIAKRILRPSGRPHKTFSARRYVEAEVLSTLLSDLEDSGYTLGRCANVRKYSRLLAKSY